MRPQKSSLKLINVFVRGKIDFYKVGEGYWMMVPKSFSQDLSIISHVCFVSNRIGCDLVTKQRLQWMVKVKEFNGEVDQW